MVIAQKNGRTEHIFCRRKIALQWQQQCRRIVLRDKHHSSIIGVQHHKLVGTVLQHKTLPFIWVVFCVVLHDLVHHLTPPLGRFASATATYIQPDSSFLSNFQLFDCSWLCTGLLGKPTFSDRIINEVKQTSAFNSCVHWIRVLAAMRFSCP